MFKPARILVPTDMSEHSDRSVREAFDIARHYNAEVVLLHVIHDPMQQCTADFSISEELQDQMISQLQESARNSIRRQLSIFPSVDPNSITIEIKIGDPYHVILKEAEERKIDLIVISSLGSSGLAKYLMGSVARHVLLEADCSVLLTK